MRGFGALPRRGAEVGGILLGQVQPGSPATVTVEDFEPVPCEYLMGPSYNLSDKDRRAMEAALAGWQNRHLSVVGFFRSHTRKDLYLDDADIGLLARYFSSPTQVFLLIKPFATRTSQAGFFFWEDGEIHRDSSYLEFPFHRRELGGGEGRPVLTRREAPPPAAPQEVMIASQPRPVSFAVSSEVEPPSPSLSLTQPVPVHPRTATAPLSILAEPQPLALPAPANRTRIGIWLWAPVILAIAIAGGGLGFLASKKMGTAAATPAADTSLPLHLVVTENPALSYLEVQWDRSSAAIGAAKRGLLSIQDGPNRRDLELSAIQLRDGRVRYSRLTGDVSLRLEVFAGERDSISESIRILSAEPAPRAAPAAVSPPVVASPLPPPTSVAAGLAPAPAPPKVEVPPKVEAPPPPVIPAPKKAVRVARAPAPARPRPVEPKPAETKPPVVSEVKPPEPKPTPPASEPAPAEPAPEILRPGRRR
ncbi:MAG: hypothetical protein HYR60_04950 [Acidobacteria bacterium]|nr:hypothetical protein [Acidobacteriota bacterium]